MSRTAKVLRYTAFTLMALFGLVGGMFVIGEVFTDPGGWTAVWLTALWLVPLVTLGFLAARNPDAAAPVLVWVTTALVVLTLADSVFGIVPRDDWGPVAAIAVFVLGVALAFLGLHRSRLAGLLMVVAALGQLVATVLAVAVNAAGEVPGPGALLGGSSGIVVTPLLLVGLLFLVAGSLDHEPLRPPRTPRLRPVH